MRGQGQETEARMIEMATPLFVELGFEKVSTRMIADATGVTVPTIYLYFKDKRALYMRCCFEAFQRNSRKLPRAVKKGGSREAKIFLAIRTIASALVDEPYVAMIFQRELADADIEMLNMLDRETFREPLAILQRLIDESDDSPAAKAGISIYALTFGLVQFNQIGTPVLKDLFALPDRTDGIARHVMSTILPKTYARMIALDGE